MAAAPTKNGYPVDTHKMADSSLDDMQDSKLVLLEEGRSAQDFLKQKIKKNKLFENQDAFFVADLGDVVHKHLGFLQELPRVKPFYAVKCNNSKMVLQTLATLGTGMILRIKTEDSNCICQLSKKYGTPIQSCEYLLEAAKRLKIQVIGVSFHIGSASRNAYAFRQAISDSRCVFDIGIKIGHRMRLLDIGGGLPGIRHFKPAFEEVSPVINEALNQYFPMEQGLDIIAEPGRYYVGSAYTAALNIIAKKTDIDPAQPLHPSTLWGPSCADIDVLVNDIDLPELNIGDWIMFQNIGAYSISIHTKFNGFSCLPVYYVLSRDVWHLLEKQMEE
ncbi:ornithine decarboxylase-like [Pelodytes ibericus]